MPWTVWERHFGLGGETWDSEVERFATEEKANAAADELQNGSSWDSWFLVFESAE